MLEKRSLDEVVQEMCLNFSNDMELGTQYRKFSNAWFGNGQDPLLKSYPNDMELGKKLREIVKK
jgi:hypothetical protein